MATSITSDEHIPTETSFKVSAGPGAGKTHWLSQHINDVIAHGTRLGITRKIACISYTNVGTETIKERLVGSNDCVDVCTIHSFLYKNIVKPFLHLEADFFGLAPEKIKVVPLEPFLTEGFVRKVLEKYKRDWIDHKEFLEALKKSKWQYVDHKYIAYKPNYSIKVKTTKGKEYYIPNKAYNETVELRWSAGFITYDDIIYIATVLIKRQPAILNVIKSRYPYFFIDEFQDSIPPIIDFVNTLGQKGIIIGVVGDKAQTIYDFIGASVESFDNFKIPGMVEYEIHDNRRSTEQIISLLNTVRPDFKQHSVKGLTGSKPSIIVGNKLDAYQKIREIIGSDDIHTLAYPRVIANAMNFQMNENLVDGKIIDEDFDSNFIRGTYIRNLLKATEYANVNALKDAWHQLDMLNSDRTITIGWLRKLLMWRSKYANCSLYDFHQYVKKELRESIPDLNRGKVKDFYENHTYLQMALSVPIADVVTLHKTIHKSKGEEYDSVMLILNDSKELSFLIKPQIYTQCEHRVYYVAISRAVKNLYISVPDMSIEIENKLKGVPITISRLEGMGQTLF